jgi:uncharacterized OsmC-like protein
MTHIDITYEGDLSTRCIHSDNGSEVLTDAPKENQGLGRVFSPTDLFAASFGSCMMTMMGFTAKRLNIDIKGMRATVTKEMAEAPARRIGKLHIEFTCPYRFPEDVTQKLTQAAANCAVHKSLHPDIIVEIIYRWGES